MTQDFCLKLLLLIKIFNVTEYFELFVFLLDIFSSSSDYGCKDQGKNVTMSSYDDNFRQRVISIRMVGNPETFNPDMPLNEQPNSIQYNPKLEINRSNFSLGKTLGSGNFGSVFEGKSISFSLYETEMYKR